MTEQKPKMGFEIARTKYVFYSEYLVSPKYWGPTVIGYMESESFRPSPIMSAGLNYGLTVFEGMKAFRHKSGEIFIFRPSDHAKRFARSMEGLAMPAFPPEKFVEAVHRLVRANANFVPEYRQGSLYIRPIAWGGNKLGFAFAPDLTYTAAFWCSPVGNYYTEGLKPISVFIMKEMTRAMPGGVGYCKASGNYEISRKAQLIAKQNGCQDALFLDGRTKTHIEELGAANVFVIKKNVLCTPLLRDTILPGITRRSIMTLAESELNLEVREKDIAVKELVKAGEVFASGTAAVITPVGKAKDGKKEYTIGNGEVGISTKKLYDLLTGIQYGDIPDKFGWLEKVDI